MALQLRLTASRYDQPDELGKQDSPTTTRSQGEVFEANSQEEYDRLIAAGAAEDPDEAAKRRQEELDAAQARLDAEKAALDAQFEADKPADELKGQALDAALVDAGLPVEGSADEKRAALADHQAQNA